MKKLIALLSTLVLTLTIAGCASGAGARSAWSGRNIEQNSLRDSWTITAATLRGRSTRTVDMTTDQLAALHVTSFLSGGEVQLTITQGNVSASFYLTGEYNQAIDTGAFEPGQIDLRLDFWDAEDVHVNMGW